jgi:hypothetical protein
MEAMESGYGIHIEGMTCYLKEENNLVESREGLLLNTGENKENSPWVPIKPSTKLGNGDGAVKGVRTT